MAAEYNRGTSRGEEHGKKAVCDLYLCSSGFTAVNEQTYQSSTSQPLATVTSSPKPPKRKANGSAKRRRNPGIAQYLGLGRRPEPSHLEKYAPFTEEPASSLPKREDATKRRKLNKGAIKSKRNPDTKPVGENGNIAVTDTAILESTKNRLTNLTPEGCFLAEGLPTPLTQDILKEDISQRSANGTNPDRNHSCHRIDPYDFTSVPKWSAGHQDRDHLLKSDEVLSCDEEIFDDELVDEDFLALASSVTDIVADTKRAGGQPGNHEGAEAFAVELQKSGFISSQRSQQKKFISPTTPITRFLASTAPEHVEEARQPIARSPFPTAVRDRSPIIGLTSSGILRTCFRIGELINQAHQTSKTGNLVTFELYARVLRSERNAVKQTFVLCDLFHTKAPHITATYHASIWKSVELFEYDSKRLLKQGRMCRCIGRMRRDGKSWHMIVMNIWETTWDDIRWVKGIVNA